MIEKKRYCLIVFILSALSMNAQIIIGSYKVEDRAMATAEIGRTFDFENNGTFYETIYEHLGKKTISGGKYILKGDNLILKYQKLSDPLPNPINIVKSEELNASSDSNFNPLFTKIKVFNSNGNPQTGVHLVLLNNDKKPVLAFSSDSIGNFPYLSLYDKYITDFKVTFIGHKEVLIKTDSLFNYQTNIEIKLNDSSLQYENREKTITYFISKLTQEKIELVSNKGENEIILIKK